MTVLAGISNGTLITILVVLAILALILFIFGRGRW
jgi:membrane-bound ClpP family serine protease